MEFLGVGPMELILILVIALIFMGPKDMAKAGKSLGKGLGRILRSPTWAYILQTSQTIRNLPNRLIREAGLEEELEDLKASQDDLRRQVNEVQRIRDPLHAGARELQDDAKMIGFAAWTGQSTARLPAAPTIQAEPEALSAWITPPKTRKPSAPAPRSPAAASGSAEIVTPKPPPTPPEN